MPRGERAVVRKSPAGGSGVCEYLRATPSAPCLGWPCWVRSWFENFLLTSLPLAGGGRGRFQFGNQVALALLRYVSIRIFGPPTSLMQASMTVGWLVGWLIGWLVGSVGVSEPVGR